MRTIPRTGLGTGDRAGTSVGPPAFGGAQLRYLVECDAGIVGAFGFGPPAFHLAGRDQWIGWSLPAREQNRGQVIGLSRFLIRSGLRVRNLASQCYGLVLRQVAGDWQARHGVRPVLVETYVDRERHDGRSLGTAGAEVWARPEASDPTHRNEPSVDEKESGRWLRAFQAGSQRARQMPQTQVVICGDREADIYELYDQIQAAPKNVHLLVRGQHDRCLSDGTRLLATLTGRPLGGELAVAVPRRAGRPARTATLELRWQEVELRPPAVALKKSWPALKVWAVLARETGVPAGAEGITWLLLTTWPATTLKMARRLVRWYSLRWGIKCWHKVLKVVCGVERRQMKSASALERALALDMIIASRVLLLTRLGRQHPDLPAELCYTLHGRCV